MKKQRGVLIFWGVIVAVIAIAFVTLLLAGQRPGRLDGFAQCLKDKGAIFYGAFWCPHCQATKAMFGSSAKYLPYVECSTPNRAQTQVCKDKDIQSYPTWIFASGERYSGERTLAELARSTGCELPL